MQVDFESYEMHVYVSQMRGSAHWSIQNNLQSRAGALEHVEMHRSIQGLMFTYFGFTVYGHSSRFTQHACPVTDVSVNVG